MITAIKPLAEVADHLPSFTVDKHAPLSEEEKGGFFTFGAGDGEIGHCKFHIIEDFIAGYLEGVRQ